MTSLLPPNATRLERGLEAGIAAIAGVEMPIEQLWDPATCALDLLPWLAWSLSTDNWDPDWSEATKRDAVARSIALHRVKGTRVSVEAVLARFDQLLTIVEWHQANPRAAPHTFEVILPLGAAGGKRATARFAEAVIREVSRVKPLREHFVLVQQLTATAAIRVVGAARAVRFDRLPGIAAPDADPWWLTVIQTEDGEPLQAESGALLEEE